MKVTVYFNDAAIISTRIWNNSGIVNTTKYFGSSAYTVQGDLGTIHFEATPDDGYVFDRWYYRIGDEIYDEDFIARESTANPFTYSGTEDIVIRAAGIESGWEEPDEPSINIAKWDWYSSNGSTSALLTFSTYSFLGKGNSTEFFVHTVWNDMVDKVYDLLEVTTNWWIPDYTSYNGAKIVSSPYELTADKFNSLRNNLDSVCKYLNIPITGIGKVYSYDKDYPVKASYFTTITDTINQCIDSL